MWLLLLLLLVVLLMTERRKYTEKTKVGKVETLLKVIGTLISPNVFQLRANVQVCLSGWLAASRDACGPFRSPAASYLIALVCGVVLTASSSRVRVRAPAN